MNETRKLAAILVADVVGYSRLAGADEDTTLARLRALRSDLIDPSIALHHGRVVKRTGDGSIIEFRSVVDAVRCAIEVQTGMVERNAGLPPEKRIEFRVGVHLGDVVEESDGDLMGDGVNIAARLEGIAAPGAICLSEQAYWQVKQRLDLKVSDLGPTQLKNIAEPVRIYSLEVGQPAGAKPAPAAIATVKPKSETPAPSASGWLLRWPALAAIAALLVLAVAGAWTMLGGRLMKPTQAAHLSIVALPFTNLSGDPAQDYFADGITENLTTALSRIRDSFVIARNTAFTYKGKSIDAKELGKELGVRYVLEGSVQRDQNRVRVNAQLIDAESGAHLWADRFAEDVADLFKLQDEVVARLADSLGFELIKAEAAKGARSTNPDANDLVMRGWALINDPALFASKEKVNAARALFKQALAIDPNSAEAITGVAATYYREHLFGWGSSGTDYDAKILGEADRATGLAPDYDDPYLIKSFYLATSHRFDEAIGAADAGLAINPNDPNLYLARGGPEIALGRFNQAKSDLQQAIRLSPRDPFVAFYYTELGDIELGSGRPEAAVVEYRKSVDAGNHAYWNYANLAASDALLGKMDEAKPFVAETLRLNPSFTVKWYREHVPYDLPARDEGLRKAGFAEE
jgi:adenylate cyclase